MTGGASDGRRRATPRGDRAGRSPGVEQLLPLVYDELRKLAAQKLAQERPGQTLQATALVHEAYLRLVGGETARRWDGRGHFFAAAAEAMRRILVENARRKQRLRHGGGRRQVEFDDDLVAVEGQADEILAIDEALEGLARVDPRVAELVKLRYFAGMTTEQAAGVLGLSDRTAYRAWAFARAWLYRQLRRVAGDDTPG
ncbi:MAG: ECF-type sigma factor [Isosphaeraceae bacterium]